ncbi:hypothetical protein BH09BAC5_BH09BAC5_03150 [soil metagenome]
MKKKFKIILAVILLIGLAGGGYAYYLWNMPHLDVQAQKVDVTIDASNLVKEYLQDEKKANEKYLGADGESKIFIIKGVINSIDKDMNNQATVLLQSGEDKAGVKCFFMPTTSKNTEALKVGDVVNIKGIIRSGASYDSDMELYVNVVLEKCDIIK